MLTDTDRFNGEEKDVLQSIGALKSAITVLGKHHAELLQVFICSKYVTPIFMYLFSALHCLNRCGFASRD